MLVEQAREHVTAGLPVDEAFSRVRSGAVFTIHTPVSAGNERFDADLVRRVAGPIVEGTSLSMDRLLEIGRGADGDTTQFDMTAFSLRLTMGANAVSQLHAETANATWTTIPGHAILGITNGVHAPSWVGQPMAGLFASQGGNLDDLDDEEPEGRFWEKLDRISDEKLWDHHLEQKLELAYFARGRLRSQLARHGESPHELSLLTDVLDPKVLTIGFARRFATYKRAAMIFSDEERLARLLWNEERPVQIVFAGKAHPADRPGQRVIQDIFGRSRTNRLKGRVFILEDYDMREGRYLVQGVDVWLNNPRRPLEASGTSGMKAAMNGVVNCSVLDGWWDEGWTGANGWAIGGRDSDPDEGAQDWHDAQDLYRILEQELVPRWYDRDANDRPRAWLAMMRESIRTTMWRFSTTRMLEEYVEHLYLPAARAESGEATAGAAS
jgi:starch phosphorylase